MIRHLLRLAWNRKGKNFLLGIEILVAFLVSAVVTTLSIAALVHVRRPLGFDWKDALSVELRDGVSGDDTFTPEQKERTLAMIRSLRAIPGVKAVAGSICAPFSLGGNRSAYDQGGGRTIRFSFDEVTDDFRDAMDLEIVDGRWFGTDDDGTDERRIVINRQLAREVFGDQSPVGRDLLEGIERGEDRRALRVVGVIEDYRKGGELEFPQSFAFFRKSLEDPKQRPPQWLLVEFDPAVREGLEKRVEDAARAAAPGWTFRVETLTEAHRDNRRVTLAPFLSVGLVGVFLISMVAMGLAGVFWQSISRRHGEIGVRRAAGATSRAILMQIVGEVVALVSLCVAVGLVLAAQLPIFGLTGFLGAGVYPAGLAAAALLMYLLSALAALVPARLAAGIQPAEALRSE